MLNPDLTLLQPYPFERLTALISDVRPPENTDLISLSIGEPQHQPPEFILDALKSKIHLISKYPTTKGTAELRIAISKWLIKRFDLGQNSIDPDRHVIPVNGTREAIFSAVQAAAVRGKGGTVVIPNPFYQIYEGAAFMAGLKPVYLSIDTSGQPDYKNVPDSVWQACQFCFICTPGNPTGTPLDIDTLQYLIKKAQRFGFWLASDECYSEIYREIAPVGLLEAAYAMGISNFDRCMVFHSLSKRSNLPGLRSGFIAGNADFIKAFSTFRTYHGCSMSMAVQYASELAWDDENHVLENQQLYTKKFSMARSILNGVLSAKDPGAGFYLWVRTPSPCDIFSRDLFAQTGIIVLPGQYLGRKIDGVNPGAGFVRMALVAEPKTCEIALERIRTFVVEQKWH